MNTLLSEVEAPCAMQVGERERTKGKGETETRENLSQCGEINSEIVIIILGTKTVLKIFFKFPCDDKWCVPTLS